MVRKKKKRASNPPKNIALTAEELDSSSSNKIIETYLSKMEAKNEIKIKQEENLDAEEEKVCINNAGDDLVFVWVVYVIKLKLTLINLESMLTPIIHLIGRLGSPSLPSSTPLVPASETPPTTIHQVATPDKGRRNQNLIPVPCAIQQQQKGHHNVETCADSRCPRITCADSTCPRTTCADSTCPRTCADSTYPRFCADSTVPEAPVQIPQSQEPVQIPVSQAPQLPVQIPQSQEPVQIPPEPPVQILHVPEPMQIPEPVQILRVPEPMQIPEPVQILHVPEPMQIPEPVQILHVPEPMQIPDPVQILHVPEPMQIPVVPQPPVQIPPDLDTLEPMDALDQIMSFVFGAPAQKLQLLHTVPYIFDGDLISFLNEFERELASMDFIMPRLDPCVKKMYRI
ncbi:hypothetical protein TNCV_3964171 [Trichonephila clavipes]|nr:hypothetical protein TNCV_3964171 [Trichonephila clavipes]